MGAGRRWSIRAAAVVVVLGLGALASSAAAAIPAAPEALAYVRVNQVGYPAATPKRAYLMSHRDEAGATFAVVRTSDGKSVLSGTVGASLGSWSTRFSHVYALDFDAVQAPGTYLIVVSGHGSVLSPQLLDRCPRNAVRRPARQRPLLL